MLRKNKPCIGLFVAAIIALPTICLSIAHATQIKTYFTNGTGFFVSRFGHVITNAHVVSYCKRLNITGAGGMREAKVIARDNENDLALLKIEAMNTPFGRFSSFKVPLAEHDRAVIVGFPGKHMDTVTRDTEVFRPIGPRGYEKWVQLGDVLEEGNSGGPLFDTSGNIIGVVSAKAALVTINADTREQIRSEDFGMALAVPVVEDFLRKNRVSYETADTDIYLPTDHITALGRQFVVKVRCEYKTEVR